MSRIARALSRCSVVSPFTWASTRASRRSPERRSGLFVSQKETTLLSRSSFLSSATRSWPSFSAAGVSMRPSGERTSRTRLVSPPNLSAMTFAARVEPEAGSSKPPPFSLSKAPAPTTPISATARAATSSTSRDRRIAKSAKRSNTSGSPSGVFGKDGRRRRGRTRSRRNASQSPSPRQTVQRCRARRRWERR